MKITYRTVLEEIFMVACLVALHFTAACAKQPPESTPTPEPQQSAAPALQQSPDTFFPFGGYIGGGGWADHEIAARNGGFPSVEAYMDAVAASMERGGFNVVWVNNMPSDIEDYARTLRAWIEAGGRHGVRLIPQGGIDPRYFSEEEMRTRLESEIRPFYSEIVPRFRDDPALLAWSIGEEPPPEEAARHVYEGIGSITQHLQRLDPNHPAIYLYNFYESVDLAARYARPRVMPSNIQVFTGGEGFRTWTENTVYYTLEIRRRFERAESAGVPLWVMGFACDENFYDADMILVEDRRRPTPAEVRWQIWSALQHGARGFFFYVYRDLSPTPLATFGHTQGMVGSRMEPSEMYDAAVEVSRQIRPITELLISLRPGPIEYDYPLDPWAFNDEAYARYWEDLPQVRWRSFLHRENGARYWMAVNFDLDRRRSPGPPPGLSASTRLRDLGTGTVHTLDSLSAFPLAPGGGVLLEEIVP